MISDEEALENISTNLVLILQERGWRQRDLVRKTGESDNAISRIVRGLNMPGAGLLARIAEALHVNVDKLIGPPPDLNFQEFTKSGANRR